MMKRLSTAWVLFVSAPAFAGFDLQVDKGAYQSGNGGPIKATIFQTITNAAGTESISPSILQTFCLEKDEYIAWGGKHYAQLNTAAVNGGLGGPSPDPLDPRTAWLYTKYLDDAFPSSLDVDSTSEAANLQKAI
jgi:hypothetical protein